MNTSNHYTLSRGAVVETMGDTVLVMIPGQSDVVSLTGLSADVVTAVSSGHPVSEEHKAAIEELVRLGIIKSTVSRRNLFRAGVVGAGAGIAVLSLPSVAAASSGPGCAPISPVGAESAVFFMATTSITDNNRNFEGFVRYLPVGVYYFRVTTTDPSLLGTLSAVIEDSIEVTVAGAKTDKTFQPGGLLVDNDFGTEEAYNASLVLELFSDPDRQCPIDTIVD